MVDKSVESNEKPNKDLIIPEHVAIIMDGNGRWAKNRGLPRTAGHKQGMEAVRTVVENSVELGISHLTLFGFSTENWRRPEQEVSALMGLLRLYLKNEIKKLHFQGVRVKFIGDIPSLPEDIIKIINSAEEKTSENKVLGLNIALSYGGRQEIISAAKKIADKVAGGDLSPEEIDEKTFENCLFTAGTPSPDILIRTSGEQRISNFLLWQIAYSELIFTQTLWPDFSMNDLQNAIQTFNKRDRRYGGLSQNS